MWQINQKQTQKRTQIMDTSIKATTLLIIPGNTCKTTHQNKLKSTTNNKLNNQTKSTKQPTHVNVQSKANKSTNNNQEQYKRHLTQ